MSKRIIVIGPGGSGKSYFSKHLAALSGLPLYHLDNIFWNSDKTHISREEFDEKLQKILKQDTWIIDGDYTRTLEVRMKSADTVYFLDFPSAVALQGAESRIGKPRSDIPFIEDEFDPEFKQWIIDWYSNKLPIVRSLLEKYKDSKSIVVFKSREEMNHYLEDLSSELTAIKELLSIDMQEYISECHSLNEMNELYDRFEKVIKTLKSKGDALSAEAIKTLNVLELKTFQLLREIDNLSDD